MAFNPARTLPSGPFAVSQGSFPGTDPREPVRIMAGENPLLPSIAELPHRGPGADMIGRALGLLAEVSPEFAAETTTSGWRLAGRISDAGSGKMKRARSWFSQDLAASEDGYQHSGAVKVAIAGPWTLAAHVELRNGHRVLSDPGAMRDLRAAFPEVLARLTARLTPTWENVVVQIDEPALPLVLGAGVRTPSGLDAYRAVSAEVVRDALAQAVATAAHNNAAVLLHCCAVPAPVQLLHSVGAQGLSLDLTAQSPDGNGGHDEEQLGVLLESDFALVAGVVAGAGAGAIEDPAKQPGATASGVLSLLDRLGIALDACAPRLAVSTPCGLAGVSPAHARRLTVRANEVAALLSREVA